MVCCDWGTTSFRMRLVDNATATILCEIESPKGVASIYDEWKTESNQANRLTYYLDFLESMMVQLFEQSGEVDDGIPLLLSGMASSSIGMKDLDYANTPFLLSGNQLVTEWIPSDRRKVLLISGLRCTADVMRGEEVQLLGMEADISQTISRGKGLVLLPGTHSKHVVIERGKVVEFSTFLTGELFDVLSHHSLLKDSVDTSTSVDLSVDQTSFKEGVLASFHKEITSALFEVRINQLFNKKTKQENTAFLSGLLLGAELKYLREDVEYNYILVSCGPKLLPLYESAFEVLSLHQPVKCIPAEDMDGLTVKGQLKIAALHFKTILY